MILLRVVHNNHSHNFQSNGSTSIHFACTMCMYCTCILLSVSSSLINVIDLSFNLSLSPSQPLNLSSSLSFSLSTSSYLSLSTSHQPSPSLPLPPPPPPPPPHSPPLSRRSVCVVRPQSLWPSFSLSTTSRLTASGECSLSCDCRVPIITVCGVWCMCDNNIHVLGMHSVRIPERAYMYLVHTGVIT